jgi:hypothetical protein
MIRARSEGRHSVPAGRPGRIAARTRQSRCWLAAALVLTLAAVTAACDDDDDHHPNGGGNRPDPPEGLASVTGNGEVILFWDPPSGGEEANSFNVYALIEQTGDFQVIGITTSTVFLDNDVQNGVTYHYRVTAVDNDGDESDFSDETFDTPRPDAFNVLLESVQVDPAEAAFDLTTASVVDASSPNATFRFEELAGAFRIVPTNGAEVLDVGFVDALGIGCIDICLNFAPESGYFPEALQAFVGDAYVFRIPRGSDRFFAAIRVAHLAPGVLVFDWAFQPDEGNRELLRKPLD